MRLVSSVRTLGCVPILLSALGCGGADSGSERLETAALPISNGDFLLHTGPAGAGSCVEVTGASLDNGADIATGECTGALEQRWRFVRRPDGNFRIRNVNSKKCMRARRDSEVVQGACRYRRSKWGARENVEGDLLLVSAKTGLYATVGSATLGQAAEISPADPSQLFQPIRCTDTCPPLHCTSNADCGDASSYCAKDGCTGEGVCQARPDSCIEVYQPVCGCDGQSYGNACSAAMSGVNWEYEGLCATE